MAKKIRMDRLGKDFASAGQIKTGAVRVTFPNGTMINIVINGRSERLQVSSIGNNSISLNFNKIGDFVLTAG